MMDFHEGDMALEVAEYLYFNMPTRELLDSYGEIEDDAGCDWTNQLRRCRLRLVAEVKSWPPEKIRKHWFDIQGEIDDTAREVAGKTKEDS